MKHLLTCICIFLFCLGAAPQPETNTFIEVVKVWPGDCLTQDILIDPKKELTELQRSFNISGVQETVPELWKQHWPTLDFAHPKLLRFTVPQNQVKALQKKGYYPVKNVLWSRMTSTGPPQCPRNPLPDQEKRVSPCEQFKQQKGGSLFAFGRHHPVCQACEICPEWRFTGWFAKLRLK